MDKTFAASNFFAKNCGSHISSKNDELSLEDVHEASRIFVSIERVNRQISPLFMQ